MRENNFPPGIIMVSIIFFLTSITIIYQINNLIDYARNYSEVRDGVKYVGFPANIYRFEGGISTEIGYISRTVFVIIITISIILLLAYILCLVFTLYRPTKFIRWLGIVLSTFLFFAFPLGTLICILNIFLLSKNKSWFERLHSKK